MNLKATVASSALAALAALVAGALEARAQESPRIVVVKTGDAPVIAELAAGFKSAFPNAIEDDVLLSDATEADLPKKLSGAAAVLAVGPKAAVAVAKLKSGVPSISCVPASLADPATQGTTLRLQPPVDGVMAAAAWMGSYPRVGFVADASMKERIELAKVAAAARGITLVMAPVASPRDVVTSVQGLLPKIDLLIVDVSDGLSGQDVQFILKAASDLKIPLVGTSEGFIKAGAPAAVSIDPRNVGAEAGHLAAAKASGLFDPRRFRVLVNLVVTEHLGMSVPQDRGMVDANILTLDTDGSDLVRNSAGGSPVAAAARPTVVKRGRLLFPAIARSQGVSTAEVVLDVTVKSDGTLGETKVVKGDPLFASAAMDSVKGWEFKPGTKDGAPVEATLRLNLKFQK
jgi:TonB family protein